MTNFEQLINNLDLKLFEKISSQTTDNDKKSLLACQLAARSLTPNFRYLEIGSYLGGSIQPYLLDDLCSQIYSIDKRPETQPDERGVAYTYQNNSTQRMLAQLKQVAEDKLDKIFTIDGDTRQLSADKVKEKTNLCFIDGEHTDEAVFADFQFCLKTLTDNGAILFHDADIIYNGLAKIISFLSESKITFRAYNLPDIIFVIEIGDYPMHKNPAIMEMLLNNHVGYISTLQRVDYYRQFANKPIFKKYRTLMVKMRGGNTCE